MLKTAHAHDADSGASTTGRTTRVAERVTVNLSRSSAEALEAAAGVTGDSKTEVINKALQMYELIRAAQDAGGSLWIADKDGAEPVRTRFY